MTAVALTVRLTATETACRVCGNGTGERDESHHVHPWAATEGAHLAVGLEPPSENGLRGLVRDEPALGHCGAATRRCRPVRTYGGVLLHLVVDRRLAHQ